MAWAVASVRSASSRRSVGEPRPGRRRRAPGGPPGRRPSRRLGRGRPNRAGTRRSVRSPGSTVARPGPARSRGAPARRAAPAPRARSRRRSTSSDSIGSSIRGARKGTPSSMATATAGSSSRFVRARIARVDPSAGQVTHRALESDRFIGGIRREDQVTIRGRARSDPLREPAVVVLDESDRAFHHGPRTPVVHLEVHASKLGQAVVEGQDPPDVGQPPAVDGLVVVADEEDPVRRCRQAAGRGRAATGPRPGPRRRGVRRSGGASWPAGPGRRRGPGSPAG